MGRSKQSNPKGKQEQKKGAEKQSEAAEPAAAEGGPPFPETFSSDTSVFEFGQGGGGAGTLAGYCHVSDRMEPCVWQLLPTGSSSAPKFRIIF